jgi:quinol monooxygenase YgiN
VGLLPRTPPGPCPRGHASYLAKHDHPSAVRAPGGQDRPRQEVERFLRSALEIVDTEDGTRLWFALRFGPSTFGIFDAFPDEDAREAHLSGQVAAGLKEKAPELLAQEPTIERIDVLAGKVDIPALATVE